MSKSIIYMNLALVAVTIVCFIYFTAKAKIKSDKEYALKQRKKLHNRFAIYYNNPVKRMQYLNQIFLQIHRVFQNNLNHIYLLLQAF